ALRDEIGADPGRHLAGAVWVLLGKPDPFHRRMAVGHLAAEQPDPATADDGEPDVLGFRSHVFAATLSPLRNLALKSATAAMVSLVSGRSTGSLRSADRSAAVYVSMTVRALSGVTMTAELRMQASRKWIVSGPMPPANT